MSIKLITFDLDNTLWHTDPVIVRAEDILWKWIQRHCPAAQQRFTLQSLQALKSQVSKNNPSLRHKLSQLRLEFLYQLFLACNCNELQAKELSQQAFAEFLKARNDVELFPGTLELLESLQKKYQVIALSNGNSDLKAIGINHLFDAHFHAENVEQPKPHADMFLEALKFSGATAEESLHIGDHLEQDVIAAKRLGFNTVWANIIEQSPTQSSADFQITEINQLTSIIQSYC